MVAQVTKHPETTAGADRFGAAAVDPVNLLLVDDRPENLRALTAILERPDYVLVTARSGEEALRCALRDEFAVVLLDIVMPEMDGFEVAELFSRRPRTRGTPIIFLTAARDDLESIYRGYAAGAVDYLSKPLRAEVVRAKVAVFVELYRKGRQIRRQAELLHERDRQDRERQLLDARRASEKRYWNLADAIPQIVFTTVPSGELEHYNRRWADFTGLTADPQGGWPGEGAVHPEDCEELVRRWRDALRTGDPLEAECRLRRQADAAWRWHLCRAVPERDFDGRIGAWLGTFTDMEDQKRAEVERARLLDAERVARADAEAAIRVRDEFLSIASHELKTPLTALQLQLQSVLRGWRQLLRADSSPKPPLERFTQSLEVSDRQVSRLARLVNDLLDVARITSGRLTLAREELDLGELVREVAARFGPALSTVGCTILAPRDSRAAGSWDRLRLEQVVTNLLSNALKYGEANPLEIEVSTQPGEASLVVRDRGMGIPREALSRIFDRFERVSPTHAPGGLGLGLYITRQIVEAHGGAIAASSEIGAGSTFTVRLPTQPPAIADEGRGGAREEGHAAGPGAQSPRPDC